MNVKTKLIKYIKNMNGSLIGMGIKDVSLIEEIDKNNKIIMCDLLNSVSIKSKNVSKKRKKKIYIKNLKKRYKHNNIDYMIVNVDEVTKMLKTFIRDTVYITDKKIYYYSKRKTILEKVESRYHRYTKETSITKYEDGYILEINIHGCKNNYFKDNIYYIIDTISNISDVIADILIS